MKVFWLLLVGLLAVGGVYVAKSAHNPSSHASQTDIVVPIDPVAPPADVPASPSPVVNGTHEVAIPSTSATPPTPTTPPASAPIPVPQPSGVVPASAPAEPAPIPTVPDPLSTIGDDVPLVIPPPVAPVAPAPAITPVSAPAPSASDAGKFAGFEIIPAKIEKKDDGSMMVDGRYLIKGEGTLEKPYIIAWELLTSVEENFDPQGGKKRLPERVTMLDGKYVRIGGYIAFPMMVKEAKECLVMLNQWDGCCIGVPPTPYDAIEVALNKPATGEARFAVSGGVTGKLGVKPFLQGNWLIGLYTMDAATLSPRDFGGAGAN